MRDQNIGNVKQSDYYDIKITSQNDPLARACSQIELAGELLRDFVATSALVLPVGVDVDDFEFGVNEKIYSPSYKEEVLFVRDRRAPKNSDKHIIRPTYNFAGDQKMKDYAADCLVVEIARAVKGILEDRGMVFEDPNLPF